MNPCSGTGMDKQGVVVIEAIVVEMESTDSSCGGNTGAGRGYLRSVPGHHPPSSGEDGTEQGVLRSGFDERGD